MGSIDGSPSGLVVTGVAMLLVGLAGTCGRAHASPPNTTGQDNTPEVVLARVCLKEGGIDVTGQECAAIAAVLRQRHRGGLARPIPGYGAAIYSPRSLGSRPWIAYLQGDGSRPRRWPAGLRWERYQERWLRLVNAASQILDGKLEPRCEPHHWGDRHEDRERAIRYGWQEVDCGDTANMFWRVPGRS